MGIYMRGGESEACCCAASYMWLCGIVCVVAGENNPGGPEGDTVTVVTQLLNTEY